MCMRCVLDTNILVSALRSRNGASFQVIQRVGSGLFTPCVSTPLVLEYEEVLLRVAPDLGLTEQDIQDFLDYFIDKSIRVKCHYTWRPFLPDPDDEHVLELAVAAGAEGIVTWNKKDFANVEKRFGIAVITARELLIRLENTS